MIYYSTRQDRRLTGSTFLTRRILNTRIEVMKALKPGGGVNQLQQPDLDGSL
jgi:hypothetical protein